jgi:hypothetical protein
MDRHPILLVLIAEIDPLSWTMAQADGGIFRPNWEANSIALLPALSQ